MSLDPYRDGNILWNEMSNYRSTDPNAGDYFLAVVERVIDDGFQQATPTIPNVDISPPAGSFKLPYQNPGTSSMADLIGQECARYWSVAIGPGQPQSCSSISSVSNDAFKIASPIAANLRSLFRGEYLKPYYVEFFQAIYSEVLTINWTVEESSGSCHSTFTVNVT